MLVIRRRAGESILIGENIEVEILGVEASQVKIGIRAPREIPVLRREVYVIQQANREAAKPTGLQSLSDLLRSMRGAHPPGA